MSPKHPPSPFDHWSERSFQNRLESLSVRHDWLYYHPFDSRKSRKGYPDTTLSHRRRGLVIFAELKSVSGRPSLEQMEWLESLRACGQLAYLWYPRHWPLIEDIITGVIDPRA